MLATHLLDGDEAFPVNNVSLPLNGTSFFGLMNSFFSGVSQGGTGIEAAAATTTTTQQVTPIEVLTSLCLLVGIIQVYLIEKKFSVEKF